MKWYKDPSLIAIILAMGFWCWAMYVDIAADQQKIAAIEKKHMAELQEVADMAYKMGKKVARDDCRRVRDKEEENAPK